MKRLLMLFAAFATLSTSAQNETPEWQDVNVVEVGREKPRSYFMSYTRREDAVKNDFKASPYYADLNGKWKFIYLDDHKKRPSGFEKPDFNDSNWNDINVPTNWELQGFGNAIYTNHGYEFKPKNPTPPVLPEAVPMGIYRRTFDVPLPWRDRDIYLHIGGIKSGAYVYINGKKVGYTEDSKSGAEFKINDYVKEGENSLVFEVYRWSTGSYLECQDFWRVSGIERDVYIYSQPKTHIVDYDVTATLDSTYTDGLFGVDIVLSNSFVRKSGDLQVWFELEDANGELVQYNYVEMFVNANSFDTVKMERKIPNVRKWSAEDPYLYTLVLKIKENGRFTEYISQKVGFRTSTIEGNQYLVNGKRVFIKGVNYHETHPVTGHYVDEETLIKDMELMKQANVNAIRLCHYPQQRRFYELADKYGFYVCNEANIESHGMYYDLRKGGTLGNNPQWLNKHMDRTQNMYYQTRNYPSVMFWSLGNEAGNGYNFYETYLWLKSVDQSRPVQYERALLEWNTDIFCPQYPSAATFKRWGEMKTDRPYIASEYAHAMGNSTGNFRDQWEEIYKYKNLQGGFIWDWVDQGFMAQNADSTEYWWTYGGDYGVKSPSDGNFLANGIVSPDRVPHPGWSEVKKVHQYVQFNEVDAANGVFEVKNIYDFTNLNKFAISANIVANGKTVSSQPVVIDLAPDGVQKVTVKGVKELKPLAGTEYFVNFSVKLKEDDGLLKKGYEVAAEQFKLPIETPKTQYATKGTLKFEQEGGDYIYSGRNFSVIIDKKSGLINSYSANGTQLIYNDYAIRPNFWRGPTDNDYGSGFQRDQKEWRDLSLGKIEATSTKNSTINESTAEFVANYNLPDKTTLTIKYTIYASGIVNIDYSFKGNAETKRQLFRQGMRMRLPAAYSSIEYFGRGPVENYNDRKWSTNVGVYKSDAKLEGVDYIRPQECGHHTDVRYIALTKGVKGGGLAVIADGVIEFNALTASVEDYDAESADKPYQWSNFTADEVQDPKEAYLKKPKQTHINDIKVRQFVELNIDGRMMGVGGDDSWYSKPYPQYMINANEDFNYNFTLVPIRNANEAAKELIYKF